VTQVDTGGARLDLRLVPAALTSWAVTAAGILWQVGGSVAAVALAVTATATIGWWGSARRESGVDVGAVATGVVAVAVVGAVSPLRSGCALVNCVIIRSSSVMARSPPSSSLLPRHLARWAAAG
jgi:competence protein ComEC